VIYKDAHLVVQKKRKLGEEKSMEAKEEIEKLLITNFMKEAKYTT